MDAVEHDARTAFCIGITKSKHTYWDHGTRIQVVRPLGPSGRLSVSDLAVALTEVTWFEP